MCRVGGGGAVVSASVECVVRQMSSADHSTGTSDAAGKPVSTSLNNGICASGSTPHSSTQISLDTLFKGASRHCSDSKSNLFRYGTALASNCDVGQYGPVWHIGICYFVNSLQNVYFGISVFQELMEWHHFVDLSIKPPSYYGY